MKINQLLLVIFALVLSGNIYGQLNNGLKAHYSFGGNANDISGQNNNGQLIGSPILTTDRFGTSNCAYEFPGDTLNYIDVNYSTDFNIPTTGSFSISLWYAGGTTNIGDFEILFEKNDSAVSPIPSDYHLALYDFNKPSFGSQYSPIVMPQNSPQIPDTIWHHIVGIYDNQKWFIYEDDTLRASEITQTNSIFQSTGNITIGKNFQGKIDDIRFYDRILTASEIHQIYLLPGSCLVSDVDGSVELSSIEIFPNPTADMIHLNFNNSDDFIIVSVFNIYGQEIIKQSLKKEQTVINLNSYPNGFYYIKISDKGSIQSRMIEKINY